MAAGVAVFGAVVLVSTWAVRAAPAPYGKTGHLSPSIIIGGYNENLFGRKTTWRATWQSIGAVSVVSEMFRFTLVMSLGSVGAHGLPLGRGVQVGTLLQQ